MARQKASKAEAGYQPQPNGSKHCSQCVMFESPSSCSDVQGTISAQGWCRFYRKKAGGSKAKATIAEGY